MISRNLLMATLASVWLAAPPAYAQTPQAVHDGRMAGVGATIPAASASRRSTTIDRGNVATLKVAWTFRTGDAYQPKDSRPTAFEATPIYVDGTLYLSTPLGRVIALDPVTGQQRWALRRQDRQGRRLRRLRQPRRLDLEVAGRPAPASSSPPSTRA